MSNNPLLEIAHIWREIYRNWKPPVIDLSSIIKIEYAPGADVANDADAERTRMAEFFRTHGV